ncbi:pappalysin-2 [Bombina bombina]|uniref:pappalysin-2 n=1 Tax=Bombina bombina TaxID=8345 RepID=UPI00235B17A4|nr:pappalysin-2 [Bombina bombina]
MQCFWLFLLAIFILYCWGRPQEDPITQRKQELVLRAEQLRIQSLKEPCQLSKVKSPAIPHSQTFGAHPLHRQRKKEQGCKADGSSICDPTTKKMERYKNTKKKDTKTKIQTSSATVNSYDIHQFKNVHFSKSVLKHISHPRKARLKRQIAQMKKKGRYSRSTEAYNASHDRANHSMSFIRIKKQPVDVSLYFSGVHSQLVLRTDADVRIPRDKFTVTLWVKPEGGQNDPAVITSMFDNCSHVVNDRGWSLGIRPALSGSKRDARFYFSIRTDRSQSATLLLSPHRYKPNTWTHIAVSYDGQEVFLYVDGILVSRAQGQLGALHSPYISTCRNLMLGGDSSETGNCFRGHLSSLNLCRETRTQKQLRKEVIMGGSHRELKSSPLVNYLNSPPGNLWKPYTDGGFVQITDITPEIDLMSPLKLPLCGKTTCDLPDVIAGYSRARIKLDKEVRYRVINLCEDDGSRPLVSNEQILRQHKVLYDAFSPHGIHWELHVQEIHNSSLRNRAVLPGCEPGRVGNEHCDPECNHPLTGYDGGDCGFLWLCNPRKRGDGICHSECNTARDDYDEGDCCLHQKSGKSSRTCFDPDAQGRVYMSVKELREALKLNNTFHLNVYFASSVGEELAGAATWPWDKEALSHQGGLVLNPLYYGIPGHTNTMIHEVGHALGLYHVFKGVSELESCDDPCSEIEPSMVTGDLCADTSPTPKNKLCQDPDPINDTCGPMFYTGTPYNNYMSYSDDDCTNSFTPNQVARMHCYLDLKYQGWSRNQKPSSIPLPPTVVKQSSDTLTIQWMPPIAGEVFERDSGSDCILCAADGSFHQYVHQASSPRVCDSSGYWTPEEAVGHPDVDQPCEPSLQAWSPELHLYHTNMTVPCPQPQGCMLELLFHKPALPQALYIWITYLSPNLPNPLSNLEMLLENGNTMSLGSMEAFCDMPLTIKLNLNENVTGIRLYTFDERMEIDAALLVSKPNSSFCSLCKPVRYRVLRNPPFQGYYQGIWIHNHRSFTDTDVTPGQKYQYQVQVAAGATLGEPSLTLTHIHGASFCGDGIINKEHGEECDDAGLHDGDGCSRKCEQEKNYFCRGEPSLCSIENEDISSEFSDNSLGISANYGEQKSYEYAYQWASQAVTSNPKECPVSELTQESLQKTCQNSALLSEVQDLSVWFPCAARLSIMREERVWLKVSFDNPSLAESFLVYLSADGSLPGNSQRPTVIAHLTDVMGQNHSLGSYELSCQKNPLVLSGLSSTNALINRVVSLTLNFSSPWVGVSGVLMRSPVNLSHPCFGCNQSQNGKTSSSCTPLNVAHGSTHCFSDMGGLNRCVVTCEEGHILNAVGKHGQSILQGVMLSCSAGQWDLSVTCKPRECGTPDPSLVFHSTFACLDGTTFGKQCFFHCLPPAKFQGLSPWITCMSDGLWSLPEGYCKLECEAPSAIPHARLLTNHCLLGNHDVGTVCRYKCKPGYHVEESFEKKPRRKLLKIQCLHTGLWSLGQCVPVMCDPLPPILQGMYNCTRGLEVDSKCTMDCSTHMVSTVCNKDGTWTEKLSLCEGLQGTCKPPLEINNIYYTCDDGHNIGSFCTASCIYQPSDPVVLPENTTADAMEHWMNPIKVESIMCTGNLKWYPEPTILHCIPSCEPFQGDGWCDTINNRAYCQYDGGDCCASSLSSHKVTPFAADCEDDECSCRDPHAEENRTH